MEKIVNINYYFNKLEKRNRIVVTYEFLRKLKKKGRHLKKKLYKFKFLFRVYWFYIKKKCLHVISLNEMNEYMRSMYLHLYQFSILYFDYWVLRLCYKNCSSYITYII